MNSDRETDIEDNQQFNDSIIDEQIIAIIRNADRITNKENLEQERIDKLTELRETDGKLKIKIQQKYKQLDQLRKNFKKAKRIREEYSLYFELLSTYSGETLVNELNKQIKDYSWDKYSRIQDKLYKLTLDKSDNQLHQEIDELSKSITVLQSKRSELHQNTTEILKEIDEKIEKLENSS